MSPAEHYLAALHAMHQARHLEAGAPKQLSLMATAQAYAAIATAGATLLSAGAEKLPELEFDNNGILTWRHTA